MHTHADFSHYSANDLASTAIRFDIASTAIVRTRWFGKCENMTTTQMQLINWFTNSACFNLTQKHKL